MSVYIPLARKLRLRWHLEHYNSIKMKMQTKFGIFTKISHLTRKLYPVKAAFYRIEDSLGCKVIVIHCPG